jgi:3-methyladenine DNA glycosylase/8-oxoguanine DNA glycosylase
MGAGPRSRASERSLEIEVMPPCAYRLPARGRMDGVLRSSGGVLTRLLHIGGAPIVVHGWQRRSGAVAIRAVACDPDGELAPHALEEAVARMRFALAVDDDLRPFYAEFKRDPFIGPAIRRRPWLRAKRRPFAWEALAWAITEQLIESSRAAQIQKRIIRRWGRTVSWKGRGAERRPLADLPCHTTFAGMAPAELTGCDLAPARAIAIVKCAKEVAAGRADPADPGDDERFRRIPEIGPWTLQCLGLFGRGEFDSLPAGDLAYVKLVGVAAGLGRRAMVSEVEEFYARYEPYRALAGVFSLSHYSSAQSHARGLPMAPDFYADAAA